MNEEQFRALFGRSALPKPPAGRWVQRRLTNADLAAMDAAEKKRERKRARNLMMRKP